MKTSKTVQVVLVILLIAALIGWVRNGRDVGPIARCLPFCGGHRPAFYDLGGLAMLGLGIWGLARLKNAGKADDSQDEGYTTESEDASQADEEPFEEPDEEDEGPGNQRGGQNIP